ncbi:hypothetical protein GQL89_21690 [Escherichia coli]|uniref:hypothetical protein n=1 Tax=Escherichia coli TaxID=562 RepID=UPI001353BB67|nr:hypothetical protein [Escherichia coli]MWM72153.1 hypothetical protein [Escherichia coli]
MKVYQYCRMFVVIAEILLTVTTTSSPAATVSEPTANSAIITIPVTIINQQSTCTVSFEGTNVSGSAYTFQETLLKGQIQNHPPFQAVVTCDGNSKVKTALALRPAGAFQANANHVDLYSVDNTSVKSGELWLTLQNGNLAPMGNSTGSISQTPFCEGVTSGTVRNSCTLKPVTSILSTAPEGPVSTTLTFDVVYR